MIWIGLALLAFSVTLVALNTAGGRWGMGHWRYTWRPDTGTDPSKQVIYASYYGALLKDLETVAWCVPWTESAGAVQQAVVGAWRVSLDHSGLVVFSRWVVFTLFLSFLLPIWSLSFATEALGGERESRNLVWLLTRPLPRPMIYLAKFAALLPWSLGLNLGGFALMCLAGGAPGQLAWTLYWPAVVWATLAFCSLFHLLSACFRRSAVVALVYSFFLESFLGNMPGYMKRISIGFYTRCQMFERAQEYGVPPPEKPSIFLPVDSTTAWLVLLAVTVGCLVLGMIVFARKEYREES